MKVWVNVFIIITILDGKKTKIIPLSLPKHNLMPQRESETKIWTSMFRSREEGGREKIKNFEPNCQYCSEAKD